MDNNKRIKLYLGNLPFSFSEDDITDLCSPYGEVFFVKVVREFESKRSRGFGFVEVADGEAVISALDGTEIDGRTLRVSVAQENSRGGGSGGGGGRGAGSHGGGGSSSGGGGGNFRGGGSGGGGGGNRRSFDRGERRPQGGGGGYGGSSHGGGGGGQRRRPSNFE